MWIRLTDIEETKPRRSSPIAPTLTMFSESLQQMGYRIAFLEGINELQNEIKESGLYTEEGNKVMNWLKAKMQKLCPSPDKLKDFFNGIGKKMDGKIQQCKFEPVKNAWNKLKEMVTSTDENDEGEGEQESPEEGQEEQAPEQGQGQNDDSQEQGGEQEQVNEGFWDSVKQGWNKITGGSKEQPEKPTAKKGATKKTPTKKTATKKVATKKAPAKKPTKKAPAKKGAKKTTKKGSQKQQTKTQKVLAFLKAHWKAITIIIISAIAVYFVGSKMASMFASSESAVNASNEIMGGGDASGDNSYDDMDPDDASDAREMDELEQAGKEQGIDVSDKAMSKELGDNDVVNSNPVALGVRNGKELKAAIARMQNNKNIGNSIRGMASNGYGPDQIERMMYRKLLPQGTKNSVAAEQAKIAISQLVYKFLGEK